MKKTNLEQEESEPEAESLHWGEEAESLHWGDEAESLHWGQEADSLQWGEEVESLHSLHSASVLYILSCNLCMQGWTIGFCQGGGQNISSLPARFLPHSAWGQCFNRERQTFVTFIDYDLHICVVLALHFL